MESAGTDFTEKQMRSRYQAFIRQLVPLIERGDWPGVIDHVEREWRVWDILFVWNSLRQLGFIRPLMNGKPLEKEEAVLEALLRRRLMKCFLAMGWWGAVAGDERGKGDPLLATPGQLEAAIIQKGEAGNAPGKNDMEERIFKTLERLDVGMAKSLAQGDRLEAQGEANGATLAGIEARLPQPRKPGRPRNGENKPGLTLADAARITGRAQSTISGWDANPPEGYPGRGDAAAFRKWWNESELNTTIKHQIITAGEVALENARRVASQNGNRQKPARR